MTVHLPARMRPLLPAIGLTIAYVLAGLLGLSLAIAEGSATPVWPPTGIALAALLMFGRRLWPAITVGAFAVNLLTSGSLLFSSGAAVGNTLSVLLAHVLIVRRGGLGSLERFDQAVLLVVASLFSSVVSATIGSASLVLAGTLEPSAAPHLWWMWWLGDSIGFIVVTPFLLTWRGMARFLDPERSAEATALVLLLAGACVLAFGPWGFSTLAGFPLAYATLPFVVWASLRFEQQGATLATLVSSGLALWGTVQLVGPRWQSSEVEALQLWQLFSIVVGITSLGVASVARERKRALEALQNYSNTLALQVERRTLELERQNQQMRDFTAMISHDLRAPIRAIRGYVDVLAQESGGPMNPRGHDYVGRVRDATGRMDSLIRGLLDYCRLAELRLAHEPVQLARAVEEAIGRLDPPLEAREAVVYSALGNSLPPVSAHRLTLVQALVNLLENALTYAMPGRTPRIIFSAECRGDRVRLWIEDNGVGIASEHHARVFRVFERLDPTHAYQGTGVGLAMVKRAVERMAGEVGVESTPGRGSRFWIELNVVGRSGPS